MKLQRKLTNTEWEELVALGPGVRNYRGKVTLFYNGEKLWDYDYEERDSWEAIIILPGVEVISEFSFQYIWNVRVVIMADTVKKIERNAFCMCFGLEFVKLSRNLEFIRFGAFQLCKSLNSIFFPPSCIEIGSHALDNCQQLINLNVPQTTELGDNVISNTKLIEASHFEEDELLINNHGRYQNNEQVNTWIKNINQSEDYALHRACSSYNPITEIIYRIIKRQGLKSFRKKNAIGITPVQYLEENPFADIDQQKLMNRYILELMGETV
ncbi:hypothetical protein CTEN210_03578 [Chaetoceros tenuissimus]|uniref:Leucine-rich repeat domain-containing protein n=1 Tax=Chaetoceros tenuissimus TaxID=426638 RepID=A0AAD3H1X9_9STRA|nr:hypothetical protein CTEN210_03578 [Chaetoceros tenuissimus]